MAREEAASLRLGETPSRIGVTVAVVEALDTAMGRDVPCLAGEEVLLAEPIGGVALSIPPHVLIDPAPPSGDTEEGVILESGEQERTSPSPATPTPPASLPSRVPNSW